MRAEPKQNTAHPDIKIQPPLLIVILITLAFVLTRLIPFPVRVPSLLRTSGFLLVILGFLLGLGALVVFRRARTTLNPHGVTSRLVTFGVYRFTRNPIYLGFLLMLMGIPLNAGSYWGILLVPIMVFVFNRFIILPEEEYLTQEFGEEYQSYRASVRRWM